MYCIKRIFISFFLIFSITVYGQEKDSTIYHLVRLDDMGMCHSVNMAIQRVIESGLLFSTSVMFACPWYEEAVEILRKHPEIGVGIHLTLNSEWKNYRWGPILGKECVPSLVDSTGNFFPSRSKLFNNNPKIEEIEKELRAQIERALNSKIRIDYIDYHMGAAVQTKELREMVEKLAKEYGLGLSGYFGEKYSNVTYNTPLDEKKDSLLIYLERLKPGINLQVLHVGLNTLEMGALEDLNIFGLKEMSKHREAELEALLNPEVLEISRKKKIVSLTYEKLIKMVGLKNMYRPEESDY